MRVSSVQQGTNTIYYMQIAGQNLIFTANLSLSPKLPLVAPGDTITGTYLSTGGQTVAFQTFDDTTINLSNTPSSTPSPGSTPSSAITPTATATPKP